jgi:tRNA dimethylallyltransferase
MQTSSRDSTQPPVVIVTGPTAGGKSGLALELAEAFDGVVINADSMQVYRELEILTARPGADALARAPHRLYGTIPGHER